MSIASADLADLSAVKSRHFEWSWGLGALIRVETTLAIEVVSTTDHVSIRSEEERVREATAQLGDLLIKDIKGLNPDRDIGLPDVFKTKLAILIGAPTVDMSVLLLHLWHLWLHYHHGEVTATRDLQDPHALEALHKARRPSLGLLLLCLLWCQSRIVLGADALDAELPPAIGAHHVEMSLAGDNSRVILAACDLIDNDVEAARPWHRDKVRPPSAWITQ